MKGWLAMSDKNSHADSLMQQLRHADENGELPEHIAEKHDLGGNDDEE
jgi:hypothetical protein